MHKVFLLFKDHNHSTAAHMTPVSEHTGVAYRRTMSTVFQPFIIHYERHSVVNRNAVCNNVSTKSLMYR